MTLGREEWEAELSHGAWRKGKIKEAFQLLQEEALAASLEEDEKGTGLGESRIYWHTMGLWEGNDLF